MAGLGKTTVREGGGEMRKVICGSDSQPCIVQFQHRQNEVAVDRKYARCTNEFPVMWNSGDHCRRLVGHYGEFIKSGVCGKGELAFWTEWEANTYARNLSPLSGCWYAKRIHYVMSPLCGYVATSKEKQCGALGCSDETDKYLNTDPCVWGDSFKYSNCKQNSAHELKHLPAGSLIVFGSIHKANYYLDTVFIVADGPITYRTSFEGISKIPCSAEYKELTLKRLLSTPPQEYAFYRGRAFKKGVKLPFSFTPAYRFSANERQSDKYYEEANSVQCRKRCVIDLPKLNNIAKKHGCRCDVFDIRRTRPTTVIRSNYECIEAVWSAIVQQVQSGKNRMVLGTHFDWLDQTN